MDTPFYHEDAPVGICGLQQIEDYERYQGNQMMVMSKSDLSSAGGHQLQGGGGGGGGGAVMVVMTQHSPGGSTSISSLMAPSTTLTDMRLHKVAPPDPEHLFIQSSQDLATTSTVIHSTNTFNEREGFADGFVKALSDLHQQNQLVVGGEPTSASSTQLSYQRNHLPIYTNLSSYVPQHIAYPAGPMAYSSSGGRALETPQTVPEAQNPQRGPPASSPIFSPSDLEMPDFIKAERKRQRNRIAASKCRKRKLEHISHLESRVNVLQNQNFSLATTVGVLREQVASLRHKVWDHVNNGCQINVRATITGKSSTAGGAAGRDF